ncbi:amidohydrolase family protein [Microvirga antarctica]|uniref:amidohydrolase family protein n=1 Tax=Microvirga antarctica TaxID=2819233 RepID=UPI001B317457|nr:amidohydrolase family protein [Microvirga antarctica]
MIGASGQAIAQAPSARWPSRTNQPPHRDCIIEAGSALIWENDAPVIKRNVSVRVRDDRIVEISTDPIRGDTRRIDARGHLLLPGFISGHTHVSIGSYTRAVIDGGGGTAAPHAVVEAFDDETMDDLMAFNLLELLRSGVTTIVNQDHNVRRAYSYVRVASRWAARGYPSGMIPGVERLFPVWGRKDDKALYDSVPDTLVEIEANRQFGLRYNGSEDGRIRPNMAPHATDTHTPETMGKILEAAKELGNGIHLHLSQSDTETQRVKKLWGVTPAAWLKQLGFYDVPVFAAHMSGLDLENDLKILAENNVFFATCPSGGGPGGTPQPWPEALAAGVKSGPAIDSHSNDMVENVKMAVIHGQARHGLIGKTSKVPLTRPTIEQAVNGATAIPAGVLGRPDLGRIAVGAKADLITIDVTSPLVGGGAMSPRPLWNLLYASGANVRNVMTDGYFQVHDNVFVVDDEARIVERGGKAVERMYVELLKMGYFK